MEVELNEPEFDERAPSASLCGASSASAQKRAVSGGSSTKTAICPIPRTAIPIRKAYGAET